MEDYNDYIIAKREYEVFSDGGYTIVKTEPNEHHLVRLIAEEGGKVSTEYPIPNGIGAKYKQHNIPAIGMAGYQYWMPLAS